MEGGGNSYFYLLSYGGHFVFLHIINNAQQLQSGTNLESAWSNCIKTAKNIIYVTKQGSVTKYITLDWTTYVWWIA